MKNFIDFIVDAAKDNLLAESFHDFLKGADHNEIASWMKDKGYEVNEDECKKMADNKDDIKASKLGLY